jgi:hypothetical protein
MPFMFRTGRALSALGSLASATAFVVAVVALPIASQTIAMHGPRIVESFFINSISCRRKKECWRLPPGRLRVLQVHCGRPSRGLGRRPDPR